MKKTLSTLLVLISYGNLIIGSAEKDIFLSSLSNKNKMSAGLAALAFDKASADRETAPIHYNFLTKNPAISKVRSPNNKYLAVSQSLQKQFTIFDPTNIVAPIAKKVNVYSPIIDLLWTDLGLQVFGFDIKDNKILGYKNLYYSNEVLKKWGINID